MELIPRRQLPHRLPKLEGAIGSFEHPLGGFLQERLQDGIVLPPALGIKLFEAFFGSVPTEAYTWGTDALKESTPGTQVLECIDRCQVVPLSLAWEYITPPEGDMTILEAEGLPDGFFAMKSQARVTLIGDPLRVKNPGSVASLVLRQAPNEINVPLDLLVKLRNLGFEPDERIPVGDSIQMLDSLGKGMSGITVVIPTWADMGKFSWATHNRFPKNDISVFLFTAGLVRQHGPNEAFGRILESCKSDNVRRNVFRRGEPKKTADEVAGARTAGDLASGLGDLSDRPLEGLSRFSPGWLNYPPGSDRKVRTVYIMGDTDYSIVVPPPHYWDKLEQAWYLYRAMSFTRKGMVILQEGGNT